MLRALATPFQLPHGEIVSVASLGIAVTGDPRQDPDDLVRDADAAMYRAKEAGGARVTLFDEVTRVRALSRLHTEQHDRLRELGCDDAQGFLFGRPEPPDVIDRLLAR